MGLKDKSKASNVKLCSKRTYSKYRSTKQQDNFDALVLGKKTSPTISTSGSSTKTELVTSTDSSSNEDEIFLSLSANTSMKRKENADIKSLSSAAKKMRISTKPLTPELENKVRLFPKPHPCKTFQPKMKTHTRQYSGHFPTRRPVKSPRMGPGRYINVPVSDLPARLARCGQRGMLGKLGQRSGGGEQMADCDTAEDEEEDEMGDASDTEYAFTDMQVTEQTTKGVTLTSTTSEVPKNNATTRKSTIDEPVFTFAETTEDYNSSIEKLRRDNVHIMGITHHMKNLFSPPQKMPAFVEDEVALLEPDSDSSPPVKTTLQDQLQFRGRLNSTLLEDDYAQNIDDFPPPSNLSFISEISPVMTKEIGNFIKPPPLDHDIFLENIPEGDEEKDFVNSLQQIHETTPKTNRTKPDNVLKRKVVDANNNSCTPQHQASKKDTTKLVHNQRTPLKTSQTATPSVESMEDSGMHTAQLLKPVSTKPQCSTMLVEHVLGKAKNLQDCVPEELSEIINSIPVTPRSVRRRTTTKHSIKQVTFSIKEDANETRDGASKLACSPYPISNKTFNVDSTAPSVVPNKHLRVPEPGKSHSTPNKNAADTIMNMEISSIRSVSTPVELRPDISRLVNSEEILLMDTAEDLQALNACQDPPPPHPPPPHPPPTPHSTPQGLQPKISVFMEQEDQCTQKHPDVIKCQEQDIFAAHDVSELSPYSEYMQRQRSTLKKIDLKNKSYSLSTNNDDDSEKENRVPLCVITQFTDRHPNHPGPRPVKVHRRTPTFINLIKNAPDDILCQIGED